LYYVVLFGQHCQVGGRNNRDDYDMDKIDEKVTIILVISFNKSCNKAVPDPYNPNWLSLYVK
jgi:hypothetical protein